MPNLLKCSGIKVKSMALTPNMLAREIAIKTVDRITLSLPKRSNPPIASILTKNKTAAVLISFFVYLLFIHTAA